MSIQHANRGIVKKDLQLYYNREWSKSFKGEATTNLLRRTTTFDAIFWDGYCGSRTTNVTSNTTDVVDPFGKYNAVKVVRNGNNTCDGGGRVAMGLLYAGPTFLIAGQTYTMSFYARSAVAGTLLRGGLNDSHTFGYITLTTSWVRYSFTFTNISNTSRGFQFISDQAAAGETYYIAAPQVEQKSYATLYCDITEDINIRNVTTTNLLTSTYSSLYANWGVDTSGQGTVGTYSYIENNSAIRIVDANSNTRFVVVNLTGFSASTAYTFSVKYRKVSGAPTLRFQIQWLNSSNVQVGSVDFPTTPQVGIYDIDGWQLAQYTSTSPVGAARVTWFIQDGDDYTGYTHSYDLKEPQIQTGTVPTAWTSNTATANTLTSGGGLLDISGNNVNADLTNVLFNSSGYTFGGSANYIDLPASTFLDFNLNNFSIFTWINSSATANFGNIFNNMNVAGTLGVQFLTQPNNGGCRVWIGDLPHNNTVNVTNGSWNYIGFVRDGDYVYFYVNGSLSSTGTGFAAKNATPNSGNDRRIGRQTTNTAYDFNGQISNFKIYSRLLTAAEVLQNFNATRKTYGV